MYQEQDEVTRAAADQRQGVLDTIKRIHSGGIVPRAGGGDFHRFKAGLKKRQEEILKRMEEKAQVRREEKRKVCEKSFQRFKAQANKQSEKIERRGGLPVVSGDVKLCTNCGGSCGCHK